MATEIVYIGKDNVIDLLLKADDVAQNLSSITKIVAKIGSTTIINESPAEWPIRWSGLGVTGKIQLKLGDKFFTASTTSLYLILYDVDNPDGIVWGSISLKIMNI